ncbi:MAG TPA: O-antigen ligase domain-containing protein, partial [Anaerolineales bacterium]|nr:O-antigen ligase domain-containing protein [Anaerolineales bacterium]
ALFAIVVLLSLKNPWTYALWVALFGLAVWSYGFNNVPLIRPLPLVDALVFFSIAFAFRQWWALRKVPVVRRLLFWLSALLVVVTLRLAVDIPRFGLLAVRDALFAFELWVVFPAIALGFMLGERKLNRYLLWLFSIATAWFLLYPWRELLTVISPVVGIQRPVPLFAFTTAGFLSVPAFFWFLYRRGIVGTVGVVATLLILLLVQGRGPYLAFIGSAIALLLLQPGSVRRWGKIMFAGAVVGAVLWVVGGSLTGRLGAPVGIDTVIAQLQTLVGGEGPGAGSFQHRLVAWAGVVEQVLSEPLGPVFGLGLGPDLFQGFAVGPGVLVRKPHNDFLELWARLGIFGLLAWGGILVVLGREAFQGARRNPKHGWVLALQIMLWVTSIGQPAMGFAYVTMVWAGLTGLWIGGQLREQELVPVGRNRQLPSRT